MIYSLAGLGGVAVSIGRTEMGAKVLGSVEGLLESISAVLDREVRNLYERAVEKARSNLGASEYERVRAEGRAMSMEEAIKYALDEG
jgi:hypothetical protein